MRLHTLLNVPTLCQKRYLATLKVASLRNVQMTFQDPPKFKNIISFLVGGWALFGLIYFGLMWYILGFKMERLGQFGDAFGVSNAIFAVLGFTAVLYTILQQSQALDVQVKAQNAQRFEATFFKLYDILFANRDKVTRKTPGRDFVGIETFRSMLESQNNGAAIIAGSGRGTDEKVLELGKQYRDNVHVKFGDFLAPYFRLLFTILRKIDTEKSISQEDKVIYANLLRANLSDAELGMVLLNSCMEESGDLAHYVREYRLLRYLPSGVYRDLAVDIFGSDALDPRND